MRLRLPARSPGPLADAAAGLGAMVAALEAAGALSPLSPVPGRLAALCASMRVGGHGITAAPARDLPEPWLSALAYYRRRKPDLTAAGAAGRGLERFAAMAAAARRYAYSADDEYSFTLQLAPPLTRAASWIDVLVASPSAEAHVRLPLDWHPIAGE